MASYPFTSIWINGRFVSLPAIIDGQEIPKTDFEKTTFDFIRSWLSNQDEFVISTSGSTGEPKKIVIQRDQMIASAHLTQRALGLTSSDTCLVCIDTKYIGGMMMLVRAFTIGMKVFAVDPCANPIAKIPVDQWVTFAAFVPYQIEKILDSNHHHLFDSIDKVIIGGAPLHERTIAKLQSYRCEVYATYGMTETISHIALRKLNGDQKSVTFRTLPGITIDLDERNCIVVDVPYLREPIVTNDIAAKTSAVEFQWVGRYDNIINTGGVKVNPERIEAAVEKVLSDSGHTFRFFVAGMPDEKLGSRVVLVMEANKIDEQFLSTLYSSLSALVSTYEIPKEVILISSFVETANGKINRLQTVKGPFTSIALKNNQR